MKSARYNPAVRFFRRRKTVAMLALLTGATLIFLELHYSRGQACFWVAVGGTVVVLSLLELLTKSPPEDQY